VGQHPEPTGEPNTLQPTSSHTTEQLDLIAELRTNLIEFVSILRKKVLLEESLLEGEGSVLGKFLARAQAISKTKLETLSTSLNECISFTQWLCVQLDIKQDQIWNITNLIDPFPTIEDPKRPFTYETSIGEGPITGSIHTSSTSHSDTQQHTITNTLNHNQAQEAPALPNPAGNSHPISNKHGSSSGTKH
jgi:hypothetical protein